MGIRKVRIANLSPEVPDSTIRDNLVKYGEVKASKKNYGQRHTVTKYLTGYG